MNATVPGPKGLPLNTFGIAFGLAGLAGTWTVAADEGLATPVISDALWLIVTATFLVTLARYVSRAGGPAAILADFKGPVLGPFAGLLPTTTLILGARLVRSNEVAGQAAIVAAAIAAGAFGAWFFAGLLQHPRPIEALHGGYLLPTTAAALIASQSLAVAGWDQAAQTAFGLGILSWFLVGAVLLGRIAVGPPVPDALVPTLAVFSAPPAVAGNAWFATGAGADQIQHMLLGTFVLLIGAQLVLVPRYLRLPFAIGWWALTFTTAASATYTVHWLATTRPPGWKIFAWCAVLAASAVVCAIAVMSIRQTFAARSAKGLGPAGDQATQNRDVTRTAK